LELSQHGAGWEGGDDVSGVNIDVDKDDNDGGIVVVVIDRDEERVRGGGEDAAAIPLSHHRAV
jgi:hypothetical protein